MRRWAMALGAFASGLASGAVVFTLSGADATVAVPAAAAASAGAGAAPIVLPVAGAPASGGDGGLATDAQLSGAKALAVGPTGVVVVDTGFHRVRLIGADGVIRRVAGSGVAGFGGDGGPAGAALLASPSQASVDASGAVHVVDAGNRRIRRVAPDGTIATVAGTGDAAVAPDGAVAAASPVLGPVDPAVDAAGRLVFVEAGRVRRVEPDGTLTTVAAYGAGVRHLAVDGASAWLVRAAGPGEELVRVDGEGAPVVLAATGSGALAGGCQRFTASLALGAVCARTSPGAGSLTRFAPSGGAPAALPTADADGPDWVTGVAADGATLLVATLRYQARTGEAGENAVRRLDPGAGTHALVAGPSNDAWGDGGDAGRAGLEGAADVAVGEDGTVYVAGDGGRRIRAVHDGRVTTLDVQPAAGVAVSASARLAVVGEQLVVASRRCPVDGGSCGGVRTVGAGPVGALDVGQATVVAVRRDGAVAVGTDTSSGSGTIGIVGADGRAVAVVSAAPLSDDEGTPALDLLPLQGLQGVAFDRAGRLWFTDRAPAEPTRSRLRRVGTDGRVVTVASSTTAAFGDVAADAAGNVFVVQGAAVVRVGPDGRATVVAGRVDAPGDTGDGGLATDALLTPAGIAVGGTDVYVAGGGRVRRIAGVAGLEPAYAGVTVAATLRGRAVVPVAGPRRATGTVRLRLAEDALCAVAAPVLHGGEPVTALRLRRGAYATNGPEVVDLTPLTAGERCVPAPLEVVAALAAEPASFHVEAVSAARPGGLMRGQLVPATG